MIFKHNIEMIFARYMFSFFPCGWFSSPSCKWQTWSQVLFVILGQRDSLSFKLFEGLGGLEDSKILKSQIVMAPLIPVGQSFQQSCFSTWVMLSLLVQYLWCWMQYSVVTLLSMFWKYSIANLLCWKLCFGMSSLEIRFRAMVILVKEHWVAIMAGSYTTLYCLRQRIHSAFRSGSNCFQMKPEHRLRHQQ